MGEALIARAKADTATTEIFGTRIFWQVRPQKAPGNGYPALVLQVISGERTQHLDGFDDMATARVQLSSFAKTYGKARTGAEAAIAALVPEAEVGGIVFWRASAEEPRDLGEQTETDFIFHAAADLIVRWGTSG